MGNSKEKVKITPEELVLLVLQIAEAREFNFDDRFRCLFYETASKFGGPWSEFGPHASLDHNQMLDDTISSLVISGELTRIEKTERVMVNPQVHNDFADYRLDLVPNEVQAEIMQVAKEFSRRVRYELY
ncbi:MAG: hypothetical protein AAB453_00565 [Patescibacteria group bacterium]